MLDFLKYSKLYFIFSAIFIVPSIISLVLYGFKPAIDFTGGSLLEVSIQSPDSVSTDSIQQIASQTTEVASVQATNDSFIIRSQTLTSHQSQQIVDQLTQEIGQAEEVRFDTVGPTLGKELLRKTLYAAILAGLVITAYVAYQFSELKYGICAILAMLHDTLIVAGIFSLLGHLYGIEVDTLFVTALLTVMSFSVHDTIVVYDRIRESLRNHPRATFDQIVNKSIAETLSRSVNNSMTIIFMLTALWLLGGETTKWFVFALLIGTIAGTYSSTFTAAPLLVVWNKLSKSK